MGTRLPLRWRRLPLGGTSPSGVRATCGGAARCGRCSTRTTVTASTTARHLAPSRRRPRRPPLRSLPTCRPSRSSHHAFQTISSTRTSPWSRRPTR
uniref:Uncharacterized protein n=1 Tax=Arundo donax TaxID=35708 RepID=A0A0A9D8G4_ARUDO